MRAILAVLLSMTICLSTFSQDGEDWRLYKPTKAQQTGVEIETPEAVQETVPEAVPKVKPRTELIPRATSQKEPKKGEIRYIQDERIGILDDYLKSNPLRHDGYRIQLIFGSREVVSSARSRFVSSWDYSAYEDYLPPNFRLRVGDFLTRFQAEKVLHEIKGRFPSAYIVRDKIEVPKEYR